MNHPLRAVGLFAGIGGLEEGLRRAGAAEAEMLVENWAPAQAVLRDRFSDAKLEGDVADLASVPSTDVLTAGFPCTDLSQAGRTAGITGGASGLVSHVFRLLPEANPTWLVLENVRNMLVLDGGRAMRYLVRELEDRGFRWAYRVVDSRASGVPQRRQRVILVASRTENPADVILSDDAGERVSRSTPDAYGFYWTEGLRGLGWAPDAVPTLKGGSTVGIPSPPAIWVPDAPIGRRLVLPGIEDAEMLQGFPRGWTDVADSHLRNGPRWRMVGNAVTVGVSQWLGERLVAPGRYDPSPQVELAPGAKWPLAAHGGAGKVWSAPLSMWPVRHRYTPVSKLVSLGTAAPLSFRATRGFAERMSRSTLRFVPEFRSAVDEHAGFQAST